MKKFSAHLWIFVQLIEGFKLRHLMPGREGKGSTEDLLEVHGLSLVLSHRIKGHPELEGTHKDNQSPTPGPAKDSPRVTPCTSEHCPKAS